MKNISDLNRIRNVFCDEYVEELSKAFEKKGVSPSKIAVYSPEVIDDKLVIFNGYLLSDKIKAGNTVKLSAHSLYIMGHGFTPDTYRYWKQDYSGLAKSTRINNVPQFLEFRDLDPLNNHGPVRHLVGDISVIQKFLKDSVFEGLEFMFYSIPYALRLKRVVNSFVKNIESSENLRRNILYIKEHEKGFNLFLSDFDNPNFTANLRDIDTKTLDALLNEDLSLELFMQSILYYKEVSEVAENENMLLKLLIIGGITVPFSYSYAFEKFLKKDLNEDAMTDIIHYAKNSRELFGLTMSPSVFEVITDKLLAEEEIIAEKIVASQYDNEDVNFVSDEVSTLTTEMILGSGVNVDGGEY